MPAVTTSGWIALTLGAAAAGFLAGWWASWFRRAPHDRADPPEDPSEAVLEIATAAGGLAHEIRNPLSTLKVNLQLLGEDWRDEAMPVGELRRRSLNRLATLQNEATRLHDIVDDFLRLVGRQELRVAECDLNAIVREMIDFYEPQARANNIRIAADLAPAPMPCRLDVDLIKQAMLNLCINAQEAMSAGGTLSIRTRVGTLPAPTGGGARSARPAPAALVELADTGPGLAPEARERIFEPYYSTKPRGTGLGLAITRRIIRAHGGDIAVTGTSGEGTTFTIALPLAKPSAR